MAELSELIEFIDEQATLARSFGAGKMAALFDEVAEELSRLEDLMD